MSGSSGSTPVQKQYINPVQQTQLGNLYANAGRMSTEPLQYYPSSTVAPLSQGQNQFFAQGLNYAGSGVPASLANANAYNADVLSGRYLSPGSNPYLAGAEGAAAQQVTDQYRRTILPGITSEFAGAGQLGSSQFAGANRIAEDQLARQLGNLANTFYGNAYAQERGLQANAAGLAPAIAGTGANITGQQLATAETIGQQQQGQAQNVLSDLVNRFQFNQNEPFTRYSRYAGLLGQPTVISRPVSANYSTNFGLNNIGAGLAQIGSLLAAGAF